MPLISDRLGELLQEHEFLYGVICRDATLTDIELMAQAGYHIVWLDLEHCPQSVPELTVGGFPHSFLPARLPSTQAALIDPYPPTEACLGGSR